MMRMFARRLASGRPVIETDVAIVGAGPAGLSAAIRLRQLDKSVSVMVVEKASSLGGHTLSGAVIEPKALDELLPGWRHDDQLPITTSVQKDSMRLLTRNSSLPLPMPPQMSNRGNFIASLAQLVQWLGRKAEELGVEIFTGFGGRELLMSGEGRVTGVGLNDVGVSKDGREKANFERGMAVRAKMTLLAEGCRGSLSKEATAAFDLRQGRQHQTYGLGLKEVWHVPKSVHHPGLVFHSLGYPLTGRSAAYGGGFMYHYGDDLVSVGLVVGLDYQNPYMNPYQEFQRFKLHPDIKRVLENGECLEYGARALNEGGYQSIPHLSFPGGLLVGCSAGFVNVPKIKGTHNAMKSGILAADVVCKALSGSPYMLGDYDKLISESWISQELFQVRNVRPSFKYGFWPGILLSGLSTILFKGREPWTLSHSEPDHESLKPAEDSMIIDYPKPDGRVTFDLMTSVSRTGTNHEEDQPSHLQLKNGQGPQISYNLARFAGPEQKFCPAGVYEYVKDSEGKAQFLINSQNCIHCKTCDIKDPSQNINWVVPEGSGGPNYQAT